MLQVDVATRILNATNPTGNYVRTLLTGSRGTVIAHRATVTSIDKCTTITITAADQAAVAGALTAVAHGIGAAPGNSYGSVGSSVLVTVTPTVNKSIEDRKSVV